MLLSIVMLTSQFVAFPLKYESAHAASPAIIEPIRIQASYQNVYGKQTNGSFYYSDAFLLEDASNDNPALSIASAYLAAQTYQKDSIRSTLQELGYEELEAHYPTATKRTTHTIGYYIARKKVVLRNQEYAIYAVCVRGTPSSYEWLSNFAIGQGTEHTGFHSATTQVMEALFHHIDTPDENNILWITGHSRGAAVANEVAGNLCDMDLFAAQERIHAYTYATPNVSKAVHSYTNIKNYVNLADFVTRVPLHTQWGYGRYGVDIELDNGGSIEEAMKRYFRNAAGRNYQGLSKWQTDFVVKQAESFAPTVDDYYHPRTDLAGIYHDPEAFFNAVASLLMGDVPEGLGGIAGALPGSSFAASILATFIGLDVAGVIKAVAEKDYHNEMWLLAPVQHAHSKESYIGYMHSMYDAAVDQMVREAQKGEGTAAPDDESASSVNELQPSESDWILSQESLFKRLTESINQYNNIYGTSLEPLNYSGGIYGDGTSYSMYSSKSGMVEFFVCHRDNGYLSIDEDCVLSFYGGEREDGSFLRHPDFPYCYIITSCFADGQTFQERLANIETALNLDELAPKTRLDWNTVKESGEWIDYPFYNGTNYSMADWPNTAPFQLVIYTNENEFSQSDLESSGTALKNPYKADEIEMLAQNVAAYRIGEKWGIVTSDEQIAREPEFDSVFQCGFCDAGKRYGFDVTLHALKSRGTGEEISPINGETLGPHYGHGGYTSIVCWNEDTQEFEWSNGSATGREYIYPGGVQGFPSLTGDGRVLIGDDGQVLFRGAELTVVPGHGKTDAYTNCDDPSKSVLIRKDNICYMVDWYGNAMAIGEDMQYFYDDFAPLKRNGKWGIVDCYGYVQVPMQYEEITEVTKWDGQYYAWAKTDAGWQTVWFTHRQDEKLTELENEQTKPAEYEDAQAQPTVIEGEQARHTATVEAHAYTSGDLVLSGHALSPTGGRIAEVGVYAGSTAGSMSLLGSDDTYSLNSNYIDFYYPLDSLSTNSFCYQAYAVVDDMWFWSDVVEVDSPLLAAQAEHSAIVEADIYEANLGQLGASAFSETGGIISEVGIYWGENAENMSLLGSDNTADAGLNHLYFYYPCTETPVSSFCYQAYAVVDGETFWSDVKNVYVDDFTDEKEILEDRYEMAVALAANKDNRKAFITYKKYTQIFDTMNWWDAYNVALNIDYIATFWDSLTGAAKDHKGNEALIKLYKEQLIQIIDSVLVPQEHVSVTSDSKLYPYLLEAVEEQTDLHMDQMDAAVRKAIELVQQNGGDYPAYDPDIYRSLTEISMTAGWASKAPDAIDEFLQLMDIIFRNYEGGYMLIYSLRENMMAPDAEFEEAVEKLLLEYSDAYVNAYSVYSEELLDCFLDKGLSGAVQLIAKRGFTLQKFILQLLLEVSGSKKHAEKVTSYYTLCNLYCNMIMAYYNAFDRVANGDHSSAACDDLYNIYNIALQTGLGLYDAAIELASGKMKKTIQAERDQLVMLTFERVAQYGIP